MKIINLIKSEFIKDFSIKKLLIIILILIAVCFSLIKFESFFGGVRYYSQELSLKRFNDGYSKAKNEYQKNPNLVNKDVLDIYQKWEKSYKRAYELVGREEKVVWQKDTAEHLNNEITAFIALERVKNNYQDPILIEELEKYDTQIIYQNDVLSYYTSRLNSYLNYSYQEILDLLENKKQIVPLMEESLEKNEYYLAVKADYIESLFKTKKHNINIPKTTIEKWEYIINNKISDKNDYRAINAIQYNRFGTHTTKVPTLEEFKNNQGLIKYGTTYEMTRNYYKKMKSINEDQKNIVGYAFKNNLKHDLYFPDDNIENHYFTSKQFMNLGLHLGVIIMFMMSIMHAGVIAKEHDKGTVKLLLTHPVKRYKILLSKLLYLILKMYTIWIIGSIIMFLIVGFKYGFSDLFTAKLIVSSGKVVEINYILWYLKEMFICGIPVCCFLIILFSLSAITLNTALTASIVSIISVISLTIWALIANIGATFLTFLEYTPIPYLDLWFVRYNSRFYLESIIRTNLSDSYGIIISIVVGIVLYLITNIIYIKRDIKN